MKALCLIFSLLLLTLISFQVFGFSVEIDNKIVDKSVVSRNINLFASHKINEHIGVTAFSLTSKGWSEVYIGPEFYLARWLTVSASIGLETAPKSWRTAISLWTGKGPVSLLAIYENGGSGYWYNISAFYQVNKWLKAGVLSKRFLGTGPQIKVSIPNTPFQAWWSIGYDTEVDKTKQMIGVVVVY
ncbi:MAG: hypothetical protein PHW31_01450 [Candidatus Pacebacteria bacterium]|nr:hypothetical protein [Candidatus Paceibacterota bacterium]